MSILILGTEKDAHARQVYHALEAKKIQAYFVDTAEFPTKVQLSWQPKLQQGVLTLSSGEVISTEKIQSVYWRSFRSANPANSGNEYQNKLARRDCETMLRTFLQLPHIQWVNSWEAYQFHREKPLQLYTVHQLGVPIPKTLVGNDAASIQTFAATHEKVIFKPLYGGAHSQFLTAAHLLPGHLDQALKISPVTLQNYIAGTNIRVYVIGSRVFALEIKSETLDFRDDKNHQLLPIQLPKKIQQQSIAIAHKLHLKWTAIDWRRQPDDTYVFLEANPSPMFLKVEAVTKFPITEALVEVLTQSQ